ncbi:MAG: hypothetical protein AAB692_03100 [Patescibacteria group bacterium]
MDRIIFLLKMLWKFIKRIIKRGGFMAILAALFSNTGCATLFTPNGLAWMASTSGDKSIRGVTDDPVEAAAVLSESHINEEDQKIRSANAAKCRELVDRGFKRLPVFCQTYYGVGGDYSYYYGNIQLPPENGGSASSSEKRLEQTEKDAACAKRRSEDAARVAAGMKPKSTAVDPKCK